MEEFDRYKELKYILLWLTLTSGTILILRYFGVTDTLIILFVVIVVVLMVLNYLKEKEIDYLKGQIKKSENGKKK